MNLSEEKLGLITRLDPTFLLLHIKEDTAYDAELLKTVIELGQLKARELLEEKKK